MALLAFHSAVGMAVRKFVLGRRPDSHDLHVKGEIDARERMICVEQDIIPRESSHGDNGRVTIFAGLKRITDLQLALDGKEPAIHPLNLIGITFAVSFRGRHNDP